MRLDLPPDAPRRPSLPAAVVFELLDPIPFGFFVAALIFDVVYARSGDVLWFKSAAWLVSIGLVFAIVPRLINLVQVGFTGGRPRLPGAVAAFWLNLVGIVAAIVNAFVHSRDAYAIVPEGVWLSIATVLSMALAIVFSTVKTVRTARGQA